MTDKLLDGAIDSSWTVNELLQRHPATLGVLHDMGVHTCCGGGLTLSLAASNAGVTEDVLLERVNAALNADVTP